MLVKWTVNPQTKITLDRPFARVLDSFLPPPLPFLLPSSSKLFVSTFFLFFQFRSHIHTTMPRAKSVKPEAAPKPAPDLKQIMVDRSEFTRTRDAVRFSPNVASLP
jgi:hypothetical protein